MSTGFDIWSILGIFGFICAIHLQGRVSHLERQLREICSGEPVEPRANLHAIIREYIGKTVTLDFYADEEDLDTAQYFTTKHVSVVISDCDDKWVLVTLTKGKDTVQKLLRIDSIKGIGTVETANE